MFDADPVARSRGEQHRPAIAINYYEQAFALNKEAKNTYGCWQTLINEAYVYQQDKQLLKFYPIMDVFFKLQVKFTNIFFRVEHVNQGMFKQKGIYTAPNYGYLDRTFRAGIIWQFYD